ncbi:uncharacterized protein LOC110709291 [Chenopodium quinoa]|uniref:uncharacterized protein LOC110709291 n=1 Tax=Chenopodium quinoa TaxID=63459 RepID=UPI000B7724AF|nr:uncharacterized protein LOC110709291 [Chenopodium quinoa]
MKGVMRYGKKGKLSPKYIGAYEIIQKVGKVAFKLDLPNELERVHNVFHVSQIRKYILNVTHVLQPETIEMDENLTYEERPVKILDSKVRSTRNNDVSIVKSGPSMRLYGSGDLRARFESLSELAKEIVALFGIDSQQAALRDLSSQPASSAFLRGLLEFW